MVNSKWIIIWLKVRVYNLKQQVKRALAFFLNSEIKVSVCNWTWGKFNSLPRPLSASSKEDALALQFLALLLRGSTSRHPWEQQMRGRKGAPGAKCDERWLKGLSEAAAHSNAALTRAQTTTANKMGYTEPPSLISLCLSIVAGGRREIPTSGSKQGLPICGGFLAKPKWMTLLERGDRQTSRHDEKFLFPQTAEILPAI